MLPGGHYGPDDLAAVAQQVATLADPSLLQLAWEISEASALYTVPGGCTAGCGVDESLLVSGYLPEDCTRCQVGASRCGWMSRC